MPYSKLLILFCLSVGCYASNVLPKHNNNFENNTYDHVKAYYKRMKVETTELDHSRHLSDNNHPPVMVNNVSVSLSSISVHQGGAINISFTTTSGKFPSLDDYLMIVYDDIVFNTTDSYDWSSPDRIAEKLGDLKTYNPTISAYESLYNKATGVLRDFILPYYPAKFKAVIFTPGDSFWYNRAANYILGESQVFETIDSNMTVVATQKDRQVTFNVAASAPIASEYCSYIIILDNETVPDRMDSKTFYSWKPKYNYSGFPDYTDGRTVAKFGGWDKNWPKGEYKLIAFVSPVYFSEHTKYRIAVSNTISVKTTVCKQNKEKCTNDWDCCHGTLWNLDCRKFNFGLFGLRTVKKCA